MMMSVCFIISVIADLIRRDKMPSSDTQFSKDKQPERRRGKAEKTLLIEAMKRQGRTVEGFYDMLIDLSLIHI